MWMLALLIACGNGEDTDVTDDTTDTAPQGPVVDVVTTLGSFAVRLDEEKAPITTANFLTYVDEGFYDGDDGLGATVFDRVFPDFVIQAGAVTATGADKETHAPIVLESQNGLSNLRGTIAMGRDNSVRDSDTATSPFFVNLTDNSEYLDYIDESEPGYAVFGEVAEGIDTIDAIAAVEARLDGKPTTDVVITDCERRP